MSILSTALFRSDSYCTRGACSGHARGVHSVGGVWYVVAHTRPGVHVHVAASKQASERASKRTIAVRGYQIATASAAARAREDTSWEAPMHWRHQICRILRKRHARPAR